MADSISPPRAYRWNDGLPRIANDFTIALNGEPLPDKGITAYDCDQGWVERLLYNAEGRVACSMDLERGTYELHRETLRGTVTLLPKA
jgi:hypothetical protein